MAAAGVQRGSGYALGTRRPRLEFGYTTWGRKRGKHVSFKPPYMANGYLSWLYRIYLGVSSSSFGMLVTF